MQLFRAVYKKHIYEREFRRWKDTSYTNQQFIFLAENEKEAEEKTEKIIAQLKNEHRQAELLRLEKIDAIHIEEGFEDSIYISGIKIK